MSTRARWGLRGAPQAALYRNARSIAQQQEAKPWELHAAEPRPPPPREQPCWKPASSRGRSYLTQLMSKGPSTVMKYVAPSSLAHASCTILAGM